MRHPGRRPRPWPARSPGRSLPGCERSRLLLARRFSRPANVLVLDEPTNDLDIETLELLEALLQDYAGTIFLVSHDRAFLDNVVTQTVAYEGGGRWKEYVGGYSDWLRMRSPAPGAAAEPGPARPREPARAASRRKAKLGYNEARELEAIPGRLAALEREQAELARRLADPELYRNRDADPRALNARHDEIEAELTRLLARWEELESRQ